MASWSDTDDAPQLTALGALAFDERVSPEMLWRDSYTYEPKQQAWMHELAVELIAIQALPCSRPEVSLREELLRTVTL